MTIVEFLEARITEDEEQAAKFEEHWLESEIPPDEMHSDYGTYRSAEYTEIGLGLGRWLAECSAKRNILNDHEDDNVLRYLAGVYANHPDFDRWWRI